MIPLDFNTSPLQKGLKQALIPKECNISFHRLSDTKTVIEIELFYQSLHDNGTLTFAILAKNMERKMSIGPCT